MDKPNALLVDIETAPGVNYTWGFNKQFVSIEQEIEPPYILCWSAKWWRDDDIITDALPYHKAHFKRSPTDDSLICKSMWELMDKADIVVGHNGDNFDFGWLRAQFLVRGLLPPAPSKQVDTYKMAKAHFRFPSYRLGYLGPHLGLGEKVEHEGFRLWKKCMAGDMAAWDRMIGYNRGDIILLEKLWDVMRPWAKNHPDMARYAGDPSKCSSCLGENYRRDGHRYTHAGMFQRYMCTDCGKRWSSSQNLLSKDERAAVKRGGHDA